MSFPYCITFHNTKDKQVIMYLPKIMMHLI